MAGGLRPEAVFQRVLVYDRFAAEAAIYIQIVEHIDGAIGLLLRIAKSGGLLRSGHSV
jgi:hypothetical protein